MLFRHTHAILLRQVHGDTQCTTARNDRHFVNRIMLRYKATYYRMTSLMISGRLFYLFRHHH
ncbi:Uncharacterised protein [Vibrio cholerae]|nr:Uncharacterised protein [Vibrio cholerae]